MTFTITDILLMVLIAATYGKDCMPKFGKELASISWWVLVFIAMYKY